MIILVIYKPSSLHIPLKKYLKDWNEQFKTLKRDKPHKLFILFTYMGKNVSFFEKVGNFFERRKTLIFFVAIEKSRLSEELN